MKSETTKHKALFEALLQLQSPLEMKHFFEDLCTPAELDAMADRWLVAKLLSEHIPYRKIYEKTGTSTATVTRVARALETGQGYRKLIEKLNRTPNKGI